MVHLFSLRTVTCVQAGCSDNTYIFFSSDHGYKLGEWRVGCSKQHPYESDVHIPFLARGPGIARPA